MPFYGATLESQNPQKSRFEERIDYADTVFYRLDEGAAKWQSINVSTHFQQRGPVSMAGEFSGTHAPLGNAAMRDPAKVEEYRARWLNDEDPRLRTARFTSEMSEAMSGPAVPARFLAYGTERFLPGRVKSLDSLRGKLTDVYGQDALLVLAQSFVAAGDEARRQGMMQVGRGSMAVNAAKVHLAVADPRGFTKVTLRSHLHTVLGVFLSVDDENQLFDRFLDVTGTGRGSSDALVGALCGHGMNATRTAAVARAWAVLLELVQMNAQHEAAIARSPGRSPERASPGGRPSEAVGFASSTRVAEPPASPMPARQSAEAEGLTVSLGVIRKAFDASYHPDVRRKPLPLRSPLAATARLVAGLVSVLRMHHVLGRAGSDKVKHAADAILGAVEAVPGAEPIAEYSAELFEATDGVAVSSPVWQHFAALLSAVTDSDDSFTRLLDGAFHVGMRPVLAAIAPVYRNGADKRATGGLTTAATDIGSGLKFASVPWTGASTRARAVPPPSKLDLDAIVATTGGDSHVVLLVTHGDGRRSVQRLVIDRFLDVKDTPGLLARLEMMGVGDAVDASVDF
jgi:hypothetical protein